MKTVERVHFRLFRMECCSFLYCHVNPRLPSYCPECGKRAFPEVRGMVLVSDDNATLTYDESKQP